MRIRLIVWSSLALLCCLAAGRASVVRSIAESPLVAGGGVDVLRELSWPVTSPETLGWLIWAYPLPWLVAAMILEKRWKRRATSTLPYVISVALGAMVLIAISSVSQEWISAF